MSSTQKTNQANIIDLFSGAGGLSLGAARAGFKVSGSVELDTCAIDTHKRNFQDTFHIENDVSKLTGQSIYETIGLLKGGVDGVIGGPPCQGFSCIGKRNKRDKRNKLFVDFFRIVKEIQPKFFLAENVPGILAEENDALRNEAFSNILKDYELLSPMKLSANNYGAPTTRTRVFFIGFKKNEMNPISEDAFKPPTNVETITVSKALKGLPVKIKSKWQKEEEGWRIAKVENSGFYASRLQGFIPIGVGDPIAIARLKIEKRTSGCLGTVHSKEIEKRYALVEHGKVDSISKSRRLNPNGFCPTLRAGTGSDRGSFQAVRPLHPSEDRVITPREAARLQGFPDWFRFSPTKWHSFRQIGNSVSPILAERLFSVLYKAVGSKKQQWG